MNQVIQFLIAHGYTVLFIWVLAEQVGLPVPAAPLLLAAGVLVGTGQLNFALALSAAVAASLLSDVLWYEIGRHRGRPVLHLLCRISLDPDSCVRRAKDIFGRFGARSLLVAKFIPGMNTASPPLAGIFHMSLLRFLLFDLLGASLWAVLFIGIGYLFSEKIEDIAAYSTRMGTYLIGLIVGGSATYIVWKYLRRRRFLHELSIARITPEELKGELDAGKDLMILDVRHPLDFESEPYLIPGALYLPVEELSKAQPNIPHDREVVLYCVCPNEGCSARGALMLQQIGVTQARPLAGGLRAWRQLGYPVESPSHQESPPL
jgi:membrane protein DedA with SNARE-associated domain/rhodanese-related sulfurtransferase